MDNIREEIARFLSPLSFSGVEKNSPQRVKEMYERARDSALRKADKILEIIERHGR